MEKRTDIEQAAYKAMLGLNTYLNQSHLSKAHQELIKIRASQINNCSYCIDMHTKDAIENGETVQRIFLLQTWKESNLFSEQEKIILAMTEEITLIDKNGLTETTYQQALHHFSEDYISQMIMAIVTINAWNRIAISTHKPIE